MHVAIPSFLERLEEVDAALSARSSSAISLIQEIEDSFSLNPHEEFELYRRSSVAHALVGNYTRARNDLDDAHQAAKDMQAAEAIDIADLNRVLYRDRALVGHLAGLAYIVTSDPDDKSRGDVIQELHRKVNVDLAMSFPASTPYIGSLAVASARALVDYDLNPLAVPSTKAYAVPRLKQSMCDLGLYKAPVEYYSALLRLMVATPLLKRLRYLGRMVLASAKVATPSKGDWTRLMRALLTADRTMIAVVQLRG